MDGGVELGHGCVRGPRAFRKWLRCFARLLLKSTPAPWLGSTRPPTPAPKVCNLRRRDGNAARRRFPTSSRSRRIPAPRRTRPFQAARERPRQPSGRALRRSRERPRRRLVPGDQRLEVDALGPPVDHPPPSPGRRGSRRRGRARRSVRLTSLRRSLNKRGREGPVVGRQQLRRQSAGAAFSWRQRAAHRREGADG